MHTSAIGLISHIVVHDDADWWACTWVLGDSGDDMQLTTC